MHAVIIKVMYTCSSPQRPRIFQTAAVTVSRIFNFSIFGIMLLTITIDTPYHRQPSFMINYFSVTSLDTVVTKNSVYYFFQINILSI